MNSLKKKPLIHFQLQIVRNVEQAQKLSTASTTTTEKTNTYLVCLFARNKRRTVSVRAELYFGLFLV